MSREDLGRLLLRLAVGGMMLLHGISKISKGVGGIVRNVGEHGLPAFVGYGVYVGEVVAPLMIVLGLGSRIGGVVLAINMVVAVWLVHLGDVLQLNRGGAWAIELQALYLLGGVAIALLGSGRWGIRRGRGPWD